MPARCGSPGGRFRTPFASAPRCRAEERRATRHSVSRVFPV